MKKYSAITIMVFGIAAIFIMMASIEYGKVQGIEEILQKLARQAGAPELCHACTVETVDERAAFTSYSIMAGIAGAIGIGLLAVKGKMVAKVQ